MKATKLIEAAVILAAILAGSASAQTNTPAPGATPRTAVASPNVPVTKIALINSETN